MAEICCGVVSESEANPTCKPSSRAARRRRMEIRRFKFVGGGGGGVTHPRGSETESGLKRRKLLDGSEGSCSDEEKRVGGRGDGRLERKAASISDDSLSLIRAATMATAASALSRTLSSPAALQLPSEYPKFGVSSVCGRRREMEDMVAVHPSFCRRRGEPTTELHYFGVYDGHGCSHVAVRCRERMHELIKEELAAANKEEGSAPTGWRAAMERSFRKMDEEAIAWNEGAAAAAAASHERCRCELQSPECEAVGSTAVVAIVTPDKIVVANCGDSRAVLSRKGKAVPLSSDHRPDRPDELNRIQEAGGRVIYWGGPRVLGVLAMSRAIGDNYLKPYVSCDPDVTVMERTADDDCLILATDGLWDVVSNDSACGVASMCLRGKIPVPPEDAAAASEPTAAGTGRARPDRACSDTSLLLTKLALARHSTDNISVVVVDLRRSC
ncbi:probable protein phosphatase 2C 24 [Syzygium oleosum]|uniref:probable protein phosphatase 2C 24 n=1 Tax=Syzygium oleosum TaxID=219896 RepID=UPI0011D26DAC|nr:probable protein phosphatase 2C 24 [Syzygium oleosum]